MASCAMLDGTKAGICWIFFYEGQFRFSLEIIKLSAILKSINSPEVENLSLRPDQALAKGMWKLTVPPGEVYLKTVNF
jgi:hypothetical protein